MIKLKAVTYRELLVHLEDFFDLSIYHECSDVFFHACLLACLIYACLRACYV
jgi:hypothetical protein